MAMDPSESATTAAIFQHPKNLKRTQFVTSRGLKSLFSLFNLSSEKSLTFILNHLVPRVIVTFFGGHISDKGERKEESAPLSLEHLIFSPMW